MKVIAIANVAGGVGKTTTAHALAVAAVEYGKKVLLLDADSAATLTFCCGIENPRITALEFLLDQFSLEASSVKTSERFAFIPSSTRLASCDIDAVIDYEKFRTKCAEFDLVIIDTATGPHRLMTYFLGLADLIISPTTVEIISIRGAIHTRDFATSVGHSKPIQLLISHTAQSIPQEMRELFSSDFSILEPVIRRDDVVAQAQSSGKSVVSANKECGIASDFREVTYSILEELALI